MRVGLYKIFVHFKVLVHESFIFLSPPPPPAIPTVLQYDCTACAPYTITPRPPFCTPYTILYWQRQYRVKAKMRGGKGCRVGEMIPEGEGCMYAAHMVVPYTPSDARGTAQCLQDMGGGGVGGGKRGGERGETGGGLGLTRRIPEVDARGTAQRLQVGLYKLFVHFKAFVHDSVIFVSPPPHLQYPQYCSTIARLMRHIRSPDRLFLYMPHTIQYW